MILPTKHQNIWLQITIEVKTQELLSRYQANPASPDCNAIKG